MNRSPYQDDDERTVRAPKPIFKARNLPEMANGGRSGATTPVGEISPRRGVTPNDGTLSAVEEGRLFSPSELSGALQSEGLTIEAYEG